MGKADHWLRSTGLNTSKMTWSEFATHISTRFAAETPLELIDYFCHVNQSVTLNDYIDTFEEIMCKLKIQNPSLSDQYFVGCFISGLKDHIKLPLHSHNPQALVQAYALARNYENYISKKPQYDSTRMGFRVTSQYKQQSAPTKVIPNETKQSSPAKWERGKCFKCQDPWVPGHSRVYKFKSQVHLITVEDDCASDTEETNTAGHDQEPDEEQEPTLQISMHAISGTATKAKTFPLFVTIGSTKLVALIDSGSTRTFIDPSVISKTNALVQNHNPVQVTVANGNTLWT
jgi:RNase P subunit RPR2